MRVPLVVAMYHFSSGDLTMVSLAVRSSQMAHVVALSYSFASSLMQLSAQAGGAFLLWVAMGQVVVEWVCCPTHSWLTHCSSSLLWFRSQSDLNTAEPFQREKLRKLVLARLLPARASFSSFSEIRNALAFSSWHLAISSSSVC